MSQERRGHNLRRRVEQTTVGGLVLGRGREPAPIAALVSPLRYDVIVRAEFFLYLARHLTDWEDDPVGFVAEMAKSPYHAWYEYVVEARRREHPDRSWRARLTELWPRRSPHPTFAERVERSVRLYLNYRDHGFEMRHPITLRRAEVIHETTSGLRVERPYYPMDGCHRLALLVNDGAQELSVSQYRVVEHPKLHPLDNTSTLLEHVAVPEADYVRFLARGYGAGDADDEASLLAAVRTLAPNRLAELEAVLHAHRAAMARRPAEPARS